MHWITIFPESEERRIAIVSISYAMFIQLIKPDATRLVKQEGIPDDARIVAIHDDPINRRLEFALESTEFPPVEEGLMPPRRQVFYSTLYIAAEAVS